MSELIITVLIFSIAYVVVFCLGIYFGFKLANLIVAKELDGLMEEVGLSGDKKKEKKKGFLSDIKEKAKRITRKKSVYVSQITPKQRKEMDEDKEWDGFYEDIENDQEE